MNKDQLQDLIARCTPLDTPPLAQGYANPVSLAEDDTYAEDDYWVDDAQYQEEDDQEWEANALDSMSAEEKARYFAEIINGNSMSRDSSLVHGLSEACTASSSRESLHFASRNWRLPVSQSKESAMSEPIQRKLFQSFASLIVSPSVDSIHLPGRQSVPTSSSVDSLLTAELLRRNTESQNQAASEALQAQLRRQIHSQRSLDDDNKRATVTSNTLMELLLKKEAQAQQNPQSKREQSQYTPASQSRQNETAFIIGSFLQQQQMMQQKQQAIQIQDIKQQLQQLQQQQQQRQIYQDLQSQLQQKKQQDFHQQQQHRVYQEIQKQYHEFQQLEKQQDYTPPPQTPQPAVDSQRSGRYESAQAVMGPSMKQNPELLDLFMASRNKLNDQKGKVTRPAWRKSKN